jgi:hypothetical protein
MPDRNMGFLTIYVLGPIVGAVSAAGLFTYLIEPLMKGKKTAADCCGCN